MCKQKIMAELQKYGFPKIEVLMKSNGDSISKLEFINSTYSIECGFMMIEKIDENNNIICEIINLSEVKSYKAYTNEIKK